MSEVNSIYIRSDNAGCYHCAFSLLSAYHVAREHAFELKRFDFSDPQGEKGSCHRKAATIKSHMRTHLNSGHDIETASQMVEFLVSAPVTVSAPQPAGKLTTVKWEGVSFINNIAYTKEGLHVWRAYGIGSGKFVPWSNFRQQVGSLPQLNKQKQSSSAEVSFQTAKARSKPKQKPVLEEAPQNRNNSDDDESCNDEGSDLFFCPEEGCVKSFVQYLSLQKQLDCGKHKYALEHETLYDKAMTMYATKLERDPGVLPEIVDDGASMSVEGDGSVLPMGWALKSTGVQRKNLTVAQKNYLTEVFQVGERTRQNAYPTSVSKAMRRVKHSDGSNIFDKCDYLTPLQIAGFFSRLSPKKTYSVEQSSEEEESVRNELITEKANEEMSNEVTKALALQHPIMCETHNICEIVGRSRLAKFLIRTLHNICTVFELDVASMTGKRKQPYMEIIEGVVARFGSKTSKADQNM